MPRMDPMDLGSEGGEDALVCKLCRKEGDVLECSSCHSVLYCGAQCQKQDWKEHQEVCKLLSRDLRGKIEATLASNMTRLNTVTRLAGPPFTPAPEPPAPPALEAHGAAGVDSSDVEARYAGSRRQAENAMLVLADPLLVDLASAELLIDENRHDEALGHLEHLLKRYQELHGMENESLPPDGGLSRCKHIAANLFCMGRVYMCQAKYNMALSAQQEALRIQHQQLGQEHEDVAITLNSIAGVRLKQGLCAEALEGLEECLRIRRRTLGGTHPLVAATLKSIAGVHSELGRYPEAAEGYLEALRVEKEAFGDEHIEVARTLASLSGVFLSQGKADMALEGLHKALRIACERGEEHQLGAQVLHSIAAALQAQGKYPEALEALGHALQIERGRLGGEHVTVAATLDSTAGAYEGQARFSRALECYKEALRIRRVRLGEGLDEAPAVLETLRRISELHMAQGQDGEAVGSLREALRLQRRMHGRGHAAVGDTYDRLGAALYGHGEHAEALACLGEALRIREGAYGEAQAGVGDTLERLGAATLGLGQHGEALKYCERALRLCLEAEAGLSLEAADLRFNMATVCREQGDDGRADELLRACVKTYKRVYGLEHSKTQEAIWLADFGSGSFRTPSPPRLGHRTQGLPRGKARGTTL